MITQEERANSVRTAPLYASSYPRRQWQKGSTAQCLTHSVRFDSRGAPIAVLCGNVKVGSVCDNDDQQITNDEPTCKVCAAKLKKLRGL